MRLINPNFSEEKSEIDFSPVIKAINSIKTSIQNIDIPEPVNDIAVSNLDEIKLHLRKELGILAQSLDKSLKRLALNNSTGSAPLVIEAVDKLMDAISRLELRPIIVPPKLPDFDSTGIIDALEPLKFISDRPNKPISVRLSDGQKFMKAMQGIKESTDKLNAATGQLGVVYAGSSGLSSDEFKSTVRDMDQILSVYNIADIDADASPNYYGFTGKSGIWYIMKETIISGGDTYRYAKGNSDYSDNWDDRASLTYDYFNSVF